MFHKLQYLVKNFDIKYTNNFFSSWKKVRLYEASMIHADRLESDTGQFGSDVMKMLIEGTRISIDDYIRAKKQIRNIKHEFMNLFSSGIKAYSNTNYCYIGTKVTKSRYKN